MLYHGLRLGYDYKSFMNVFALAMDRMKTVPGGELEQAITCLNLADCLDA